MNSKLITKIVLYSVVLVVSILYSYDSPHLLLTIGLVLLGQAYTYYFFKDIYKFSRLSLRWKLDFIIKHLVITFLIIVLFTFVHELPGFCSNSFGELYKNVFTHEEKIFPCDLAPWYFESIGYSR